MDQYEQIQAYNKNFFMTFAKRFAVVAFVVVGGASAIGLSWYYRDLAERKIEFDDAKKIGNWELPDDYYVFQGAFKLNMFGDSARNVEVLDEKSGNEIKLLEMSKEFSDSHLKYDQNREEDEKTNDELFMDFYSPENYAIRETGKIEDGKAEVNFNIIENKDYDNINDKMSGFIGRLNCRDSVIVILITNTADNFNSERAMDFVRVLSCGNESPAGDLKTEDAATSPDKEEEKDAGTQEGGANSDGSKDPAATNIDDLSDEEDLQEEQKPVETDDGESSSMPFEDNDGDGLSNNVEFVISSNPNRPDTDSDGFGDFDEIKFGFDPNKPSPGDVIPADRYARIKEQIMIVDEENFKKIFR